MIKDIYSGVDVNIAGRSRMYQWTSRNIWFILSIVAALIAVVSSLHISVKLILLLLAVTCGYVGISRHKLHLHKEQTAILAAKTETNDKFLLQIAGRLRHDLLNDMQILFGYIQLKKYDNLHATMEKIRNKAMQESFLSKLGIPALIVFLLTVRCNSDKMELEVELEQEINLAELPIVPDFITETTRGMINMFQEAIIDGDWADPLHVLSLQFVPEEDSLLLDFVFRGAYNRDLLERKIQNMLLTGQMEMAAEEINFAEQEVAVTLKLPFQA